MSLYSQALLDVHDKLIVDLFAGGGGASSGIEQALGRMVDIAINHDAKAVALHEANHPQTTHHRADVFEVDPRLVTGGRPVGLLWASPDCFVAGTLVLTRDGYIPIEQVSVGDEVFTHNKRWRKVTSTMASNKWVLKVTGHGHPGLYVSQEHPFLVRNQCNVWNNSRRAYDRTLGEQQWLKPEEWRRGEAPMNAAGGDRSYWASPAEFPSSQVPIVEGRGMVADESLMWLAGRYLGDGWSRITEQRAELVIICGKHEADELGSRLNSLWPRTGLRAGSGELAWHRRDLDTAVQFSTNHRGLVQWLRQHFGHGAGEKTVPGWALGLPESMRRSLLEGYLSADGCNAGSWMVIQTVSKALAFGVRTLATTLGYIVTVHAARPQNDTIEGRKVNVRQAWIVKWVHETKRNTTVLEDGFRWSPVKTLDSRGWATVYNLSVEEDESYVAEGIVVHNCTFHSKARGGKPIRHANKKRRALAWVVCRWAGQVQPDVIILENVEEFANWGPLRGTKEALKPCHKRRGRTFRRWVNILRSFGYKVEWRELRACDYGAPTIRKRLFVIARRDGLPIVWPEKTHGPGLKPYRTAAECIDWSIPMCSVFATKEEAKEWAEAHGVATPVRPLAENSMRRIARGVMRFVVNNPRPFLVKLAHGEESNGKRRWGRFERPLEEPLGSVTANGVEDALVAPTIVNVANSKTTGRGPNTWHPEEPLRTVPTVCGFGVVAPIICTTRNAEKPFTSADEPTHTIVAQGARQNVVCANLVAYHDERGGEARTAGLNKPIHTLDCANRMGVVATFLAQNNGGFNEQDGRSVEDPLSTILVNSRGHHGLVAAHIQRDFGTSTGAQADAPIGTLTAEGNGKAALCASFLTKYYGTGEGQEVSEPAHTATTTDRLGLVTVDLNGEPHVITDIAMRMLSPRELFRCQGFRDSYIIDRGADGSPLTKSDQVRMCGNSVCPPIAEALVRANVGHLVARSQKQMRAAAC